MVTQLDPIAILFTLPQDELPRVAKSQAAGAPQVEALQPRRRQRHRHRQLALVDNQINQNTATIRLKAIFPNPVARCGPTSS